MGRLLKTRNSNQSDNISLIDRAQIEGMPYGGADGVSSSYTFTWNGTNGAFLGSLTGGVFGKVPVITSVNVSCDRGYDMLATIGISALTNLGNSQAGSFPIKISNGEMALVPFVHTLPYSNGLTLGNVNIRTITKVSDGTSASGIPIRISFGSTGYLMTDDFNFSAEHTIKVIGTSISEGGAYAVATKNLYHMLFSRWLQEVKGYDTRVVNFGRGGSYTSQWDEYRQRGYPKIVGNNPSIIIWEHGTNDTNTQYNTTATIQNFTNWINYKRAKYPDAIMLILTPIRNNNTTTESQLAVLRPLITSLVASYNDPKLVLVDTASAWTVAENSTYLADGTHPNPAGYQKMFEKIRDTWISLNLTI